MVGRGLAHPGPAKRAELHRFDQHRLANAGQAKADPPLRLELRSAGSCDAGDRDRQPRARPRQRTQGHLPRHGFRHGAMLGKGFAGHAQHLDLGRVGIGHKAPVKDVRGPRHIGQRRRHQAAGAAFGAGDPQPPIAGAVQQIRDVYPSHGSTTP